MVLGASGRSRDGLSIGKTFFRDLNGFPMQIFAPRRLTRDHTWTAPCFKHPHPLWPGASSSRRLIGYLGRVLRARKSALRLGIRRIPPRPDTSD